MTKILQHLSPFKTKLKYQYVRHLIIWGKTSNYFILVLFLHLIFILFFLDLNLFNYGVVSLCPIFS